MLQKLSKCEVKASLCGNFSICLPFRFYVKSNSGKFKRLTISFSTLLEALNFNFSKFEPFFKSQICKNWKLRGSEVVKTAFLRFKFCQDWFYAKLGGKWILELWRFTSHFESFWSIVEWPKHLGCGTKKSIP